MILGRTGFARKGEWIAAVTYDALDIVTHEGKVYIGRRESVGSEPSSESNDWAMLPGAPSFEIEETVSGYDLTITGSDGTSETISILNGEVDREELEDALEAFRSSTDVYLAPDYDDTATYSIGDSCIYEGRLYRCVEDIPTAEPWTAEHWEPVVLSNKVAQMRKDAVVKADVVVSSAEPGDVVSFDDGADNVPVKELVVGVEPVQSGSGDPSPTNIRPISGWTGVEVYQKGFNVWDEEWEFGGIDSSGNNTVATSRIRSSNYIPVIPDTDYYGAFVGVYTGGTWYTVHFYTETKEYVGSTSSNKNTIFHVPSNAHFMRFNTSDGWGRNVAYTGGICINISGSRNGEYEPYKGKPTIPIDWSSTAGTVYGGSLDLTSGVLTVEYVKQTITSFSGIWNTANPNGKPVYATISDTTHAIADINSKMMASNMFTYTKNGRRDAPLYAYGGNDGGRTTQTFILPSTVTSLAEANAWLASLPEPLECTFRLATPLVFQLTPTQIRSLFGVNTFWSDANGGIQNLRYVSDLKLYLEQLTKPTEDDMVANSNIPANTYFTIGNALYLSTAAIAAGEKIEPDTNCTRKSLADALNDLHD